MSLGEIPTQESQPVAHWYRPSSKLMPILSGLCLRQQKVVAFLPALNLRSKKIRHRFALNHLGFNQAWVFEFIVIALPCYEHFVIGRHAGFETAVGLNVHLALI